MWKATSSQSFHRTKIPIFSSKSLISHWRHGAYYIRLPVSIKTLFFSPVTSLCFSYMCVYSIDTNITQVFIDSSYATGAMRKQTFFSLEGNQLITRIEYLMCYIAGVKFWVCTHRTYVLKTEHWRHTAYGPEHMYHMYKINICIHYRQ